MPLQVGARLAHYEVTALIGEGGMGQVWQATDTKLDRDVALKVLPQAFIDDPDRLARFEREAKVLASLNHPNIGGIHGLEESEGVRALVLEYIEGPTLADRIKQGPIPVDDALPIAKQIAEALEAAHEQGIIHRDLKPANVKLRPDGTVKVLDFGLAKALDPSPEGDPSQSPTLTAAATQMGVIMGTAAYMSPEQAAGQAVDRRSDIWSLGVVLSEMLTGAQLFTGKSVSHVMAKVLERDVDFDVLPTRTPAAVRRLLRRCLEREPKRRFPDAAEAVFCLEEAATAPGYVDENGAPVEGRAWWRHSLPLAAGMLIVGSLATGLAVWPLRSPPSIQPARFVVTAPSPLPALPTNQTSLAISPDGRAIAYRGTVDGREGLYIRHVDRLEGELLTSTRTSSVFFSPDGTWVGFSADGTLKKIPLAGGAEITLCPMSSPSRGATWGPDDTIIFGRVGPGNGLFRVSAAGGEPEMVTQPEAPETHQWPEFLPGGRAVLFTKVQGEVARVEQIAVLDLETGEQRTLIEGGSQPRYVSSGHLVYSFGDALWAVHLDPTRLEVVSDPVPVQEGVSRPTTGGAHVDVSENGSLVYQAGDEQVELRTLVWVDRAGVEEPLAAEPRPYFEVQLSPDGRQMATEVRDAANTDIWLYDLARDVSTRFTFDPARDLWPLWTPDGQRIVFGSYRASTGGANLYWKSADGIGEVERLTTSESIQAPHSFAPDGRLVFGDDPPAPPVDLHVLSMPENKTDVLVQTEFRDATADVSPDGRWLAYVSDESGRPNVYVRPFPNVNDGRWQVSRAGGLVPQWGPDSRELFYQTQASSGGSVTMVVAANQTEPAFSPGASVPMFEGLYASGVTGRHHVYDVSADGQRFLMIKLADDTSAVLPLIVVLNWIEELKSLVPVD